MRKIDKGDASKQAVILQPGTPEYTEMKKGVFRGTISHALSQREGDEHISVSASRVKDELNKILEARPEDIHLLQDAYRIEGDLAIRFVKDSARGKITNAVIIPR